MAYEIIDRVNENDQVVGTVERTPEWDKTRPTTFRIAAGFVWRSDGRVVIQRRAVHKPGALKFDVSFGGVVPAGMNPEVAAAKEMQEELGLTGTLDFATKLRSLNDDGSLRAFLYLYTMQHDGPYTNWEEEAERLEFFMPEELDFMMARFPYMFTGGAREAWQFYRENKKD